MGPVFKEVGDDLCPEKKLIPFFTFQAKHGERIYYIIMLDSLFWHEDGIENPAHTTTYQTQVHVEWLYD